MFDNLKNTNIVKGNSVVGILVNLNSDGTTDYFYSVLLKKKKQVEVTKSGHARNDISSILSDLQPNIPICLSLDGKGVIHKKLNLINEESETSVLSQILPNASTNEFMVQTEDTGRLAYVSVARIDVINKTLELFAEKNFSVVSVSLGPFSINQITSYIEDTNLIKCHDYEIKIENHRISEIKKTNITGEQEIKLGTEYINSDKLIAYASALSFFLNDFSPKVSITALQLARDNFFYKKLFTIIGWGILSFFMVLLLINFMLFNKFSQQYDKFSQQTNQNKELLTKLDTLTSELKRKEDFILKNGLLNPSRNSFFADRIAFTSPSEISLTELIINPLQKKLKQEQEPEFKINSITVSGIVPNSAILNEWIKELNRENWVAKIVIINYTQDTSVTTGEFKIEITLNA